MAIPVLLVHGVRTSRTMWRAQVEALEALGHPVLAVDLPGHGERTDERFTLDGAAQTVLDGVRSLATGGGHAPSGRGLPSRSVVVVGLSLGGYAALHALARDSSNVAALVAAGCCTRPHRLLIGGWLALARAIAALPDGGAGLNQLLVDRTMSPQAAQDVAAGGFAFGVMVDMLREMRRSDPLGELARIDVPVWLVNGRYDHFRSEERTFARAGKDVRLRVVPRAKHLVSLDAPVTFTRTVLEVIEKVDQRAIDEQSSAIDESVPVWSRETSPAPQAPRPHAPDDARGVRHDDDVVPEPLDHLR